MKKTEVTLVPMDYNDRNQFILDNQEAFRFGAMEEFGMRDNHFEEEGEIISRKTIEASMDANGAETYRILIEEEIVGGIIVTIDKETQHNHLDILFVTPRLHSKGIGYAAWQAIEALYPKTKVWETCTPYFEKRNIHFYINRCGFHAVEFFNKFHVDPNSPEEHPDDEEDLMFRFEKVMSRADIVTCSSENLSMVKSSAYLE